MSVEYKDYYKTLGVDKKATEEEINKAYKKLARKYHPDLNQGDAKSEERFKEVNEAHEVLKDPEKRRMYDQLGPNWKDGQNFGGQGFENMHFNFGGGGQSFGGSGFSDFFETIFGSGGFSTSGFGGQQANFSGFSRQPRKGSDVEATLELSLEDAFHGGKKHITIGHRSLEVNIPAGIKNGARIRLTGQGELSSSGGPAGDMYLRVKIAAHSHFKLDDADIMYDLALSPWEAVLGTKARIPTLSGDVELNVKPGTSSGTKMRLRGKGLGSGNSKGDQFVRISIVVPDKLTPEEKALWEQLRDMSEFVPR